MLFDQLKQNSNFQVTGEGCQSSDVGRLSSHNGDSVIISLYVVSPYRQEPRGQDGGVGVCKSLVFNCLFIHHP